MLDSLEILRTLVGGIGSTRRWLRWLNSGHLVLTTWQSTQDSRYHYLLQKGTKGQAITVHISLRLCTFPPFLATKIALNIFLINRVSFLPRVRETALPPQNLAPKFEKNCRRGKFEVAVCHARVASKTIFS